MAPKNPTKQAGVPQRREALGLTQAELAIRVKCSQGMISILEKDETRASPVLRARVEQILRALEARANATPSQPVTLANVHLPASLAAMDGSLRSWNWIEYFSWVRHPGCGDGVTVLVSERGSGCLLLAYDVTGNGTAQVAKSSAVISWFHGLTDTPQFEAPLEAILDSLSRRMSSEGISLAVNIARLVRLPGRDKVVRMTFACCGAPPPLLIGPDGRAIRPVNSQLPLPQSPGSPYFTEPRDLFPPWTLAFSSDGLLKNQGGGDEMAGFKKLTKKIREAIDPSDVISELSNSGADESAFDLDESLLLVSWAEWDRRVALVRSPDLTPWLLESGLEPSHLERLLRVFKGLVDLPSFEDLLWEDGEKALHLGARLTKSDFQFQLKGEGRLARVNPAPRTSGETKRGKQPEKIRLPDQLAIMRDMEALLAADLPEATSGVQVNRFSQPGEKEMMMKIAIDLSLPTSLRP